MLGRRPDLGEGDHPYLDHVGRDTFYGLLASHRGQLFRDEDFADLYCSDNGRPSVAPSLLAAELLTQLLLHDIERRADGAHLKQGVSPDRVVSVHDPEMRHGRKSATKRFDGHKVAVAVDPESQLITAADVLPGNV